jgi:hypothetical protein
MYERLPSAEELKGTGQVPEDYAMDPVHVWPENLQAVRLFDQLRTQWRHGFGGPTGLDYAAVMLMLEFAAVPQPERPALFADLQVLEAAALEAIHKKP